MNKEWSEKNKQMQSLLRKASFREGIDELISLRSDLMTDMLCWREFLSPDDFSAMPWPNANGYHSKTVAYSVWHITRIEDITVNTLIGNRKQIFFSGNFEQKIHAPVITTGNELAGTQIADFSKSLNIPALYEYAEAVRTSTDIWLRSLRYEDLKQRFSDADKQRIRDTHTVSTDESAAWLIDYWCGKDAAGILKMPLSRHWIMHVEAAERIIGKLHPEKG